MIPTRASLQSERVNFYWPHGPNPVVTISTRVGPGSRLYGSRYTGERHLATQRNNKRNQGTLLQMFDQPRATDSRTHVDVPRSVSLFQNRMRGAESAGIHESWNSSKTNGLRVLV